MLTPMQGQRSRSSSLVGTFDFDNVSSPSNTSVDQPIYWNDARNPVDSRGVDLCPPTSNNIPFLNSIHQERLYLPEYIDMHAEMNECAQIAEHLPTASANDFAVSGVLPQGQVHGPANFVPLTIRGSSSSSYAQNLNSPVGLMGRGSDSLLMECPMLFRPSSVSDTLTVDSSSRDSMQDNEASRGVLFDCHRLPRKRKALEGHVGQSSDAGGSTYLRNAECSMLPNTQAAYNASVNSAFSHVSDQRDRGHVLSLAGASASNIPDQASLSGPNNSQRSCCIRITSVDRGASNPSAFYSIANPIIQAPSASSQEQSAVPTVDYSLDTRSALSGGYGSNHDHCAVLHIPAIRQSGHSVRWSRGIISRHGGSPNATLSQTRDVASNDEAGSNRGRSARENPLFLPPSEMGIFVPNPLSGSIPAGDATLLTNGASSSRSGSSSGINHSSNAHLDPHYYRFTHYPHSWSENVCQSLMSSMNPDPDGQISNSPHNLRPSAASAQEMVLPSRASFPGHAFPSRLSVCSLSAAAEGRGRLASEAWNALDIMCRHESLRYESVFFGIADMDDRHRDMRLDVDNMSYEELLAVEERIGNVSTGLSEETILARLNRRHQHTATTESNDEIEPCCICQEEYSAGDDLGALECGHDFHRDCIKQWLMLKNLCPVCKTTGLTP